MNEAGRIAAAVWGALPNRFRKIEIDTFVVMPNHIHGVIRIVIPEAASAAEPPPLGAMNRAPTLGEIVRAFKATSTGNIRRAGANAFSWQRNYYEHVIRNERELNLIREYTINNPLQWALDRENPENAIGQHSRSTKGRFTEIFGDMYP